MANGRLSGRVALVTGASSGIGQAIAARMAAEGADIVVDYQGSVDGANQTKAMVEKAGCRALLVNADVTDVAAVASMIDQGWQAFGKVDILVNNAGVEKNAPFAEVTEADYNLVLNVNLKGPFFASQAFTKRLLAAKLPGRIINISSVHEDMVFPHFSSYCASKGGMRMLMRNLAVELGPSGITVNNIAPGAIATPINTSLLHNPVELNALLANIPLGRMGTVDDVSSLASFLASDEAGYITGSTYVVDGGLMRNYREQ